MEDRGSLNHDTVTLDMGFTLVNLCGGYDEELLTLARRAGLNITVADVRAAGRKVWGDQIRRDAIATWEPSVQADLEMSLDLDRRLCLALGIDDPRLHAEANAIARRIFLDPANYEVYPDVFPTLERLRELEVTLGIVSNWGWELPELCKALGLAPYFKFILTSARVGAAKPHPAIFEAALSLAGSEPARTLHVGDTLGADVAGAQKLGITGVLIDRRCPTAPNDGYAMVCSLEQVVDLL